MGAMNYHRNTQPHPAKLPIGEVYKIKLEAWPWESDSPACGAAPGRPVETARPEQLQRLRALGVKEDDRPLTRVQASCVLSALWLLEASGINVRLIADCSSLATAMGAGGGTRSCQPYRGSA